MGVRDTVREGAEIADDSNTFPRLRIWSKVWGTFNASPKGCSENISSVQLCIRLIASTSPQSSNVYFTDVRKTSQCRENDPEYVDDEEYTVWKSVDKTILKKWFMEKENSESQGKKWRFSRDGRNNELCILRERRWTEITFCIVWSILITI